MPVLDPASLYRFGVGCTALIGIAAQLVIARAQTESIRQGHELREEIRHSERNRAQLNCLLVDLLATMNLSLESRLTQEPDGKSRAALEQIRLVVEQAIREQRETAINPVART